MTDTTLGPWCAMFDTEEGWQVLGPDMQLIAVIGVDSLESGDPCEGDARLMAAAPNLLVALKSALEELRWWENEHGCCAGKSDVVVANAHAVIAKAKGETA